MKRLLPRHYEILDLYLEGMAIKDIAKQVGMAPGSVSLITRNPSFIKEVERRREQRNKELDQLRADKITRAKDILLDHAELAAQRHVELLDSKDERVRQSSANSILDRVGLPKITESINKGAPQVVVLDTAQLNLLSIALEESKEDG